MVSAAAANAPALMWFRRDLRVEDNPALNAAFASQRPVLGVYCLDDVTSRPLGGASRWWLNHSLTALEADLDRLNIKLAIYKGPASHIIPALAEETGAAEIHWNRRYNLAGRDCDAAIKSSLKARGLEVQSHNGTLLVEPWTVKPASAAFFKVFTPFWKASRIGLEALNPPLPQPEPTTSAPRPASSLAISDLKLLPTRPDWAGGLRATWTPGAAGARARLSHFLDNGLVRYADERDRPDLDSTSQLSPHLAFGEISLPTIWHAARARGAMIGGMDRAVEKFLAELGWREFSYHLLYHFPDLASRNFQPRFDAFPWTGAAPELVRAWQKGETGYPIVDAGMRQLWQTGIMHNRVRMIVASFLVKHLLIDWRIGEDWFWDTLVDADPASNAASWQWVAGSGADAAPYFRIFNPILQSAKFDPDANYIRRYVPELKGLSAEAIHGLADKESVSRRNRGGGLIRSYPEPVVDHGFARERALQAFAALTSND